MADRCVSVPMTLSDLERRDTRVKFFKRISLITLVPFDLERPKLAVKNVGSSIFLGGHRRPYRKWAGVTKRHVSQS